MYILYRISNYQQLLIVFPNWNVPFVGRTTLVLKLSYMNCILHKLILLSTRISLKFWRKISRDIAKGVNFVVFMQLQLEVDTLDDISDKSVTHINWIDIAPNNYQPVIIQHCHRARRARGWHHTK